MLRPPLRDELQDLLLAVRERLVGIPGAAFRGRGVVAHRLARDRGVEDEAAAGDTADRGDELGPRGLLEDVSRRTRLEEARDVLAVVVLRENEDARVRRDLANLERRLETAEPRHRDVHEDDVGAERAADVDRLEAVGRLADDLDVLGRREERAEPLAQERVVVRDHDPNGGHGAAPPSGPAPGTTGACRSRATSRS